MKKLLSILLAGILILSAVPIVSAVESSELKNLPDNFAEAVNTYIPDIQAYSDYPTFTNESLDGLEFYKVTKEQVVFRIIGLDNYKSRELIDGYLFTAPTRYTRIYSNPCGYCVYSGGKVYNIKDAVTSKNIISASELAEVIPNTIKLDDNTIVSYMNGIGTNITWAKSLGMVSRDTLLFYAGSSESTQTDETITGGNFDFHITAAQSPDKLGLYLVQFDSIAPLLNEHLDYYNLYSVVKLIRKAEAEGTEFGFTVSNKFGTDAENCIAVMNKNNNNPYYLHSFAKLEKQDCYVLVADYGAATCACYSFIVGDWSFTSSSQCPDYDIGVYIVKGDNVYTLEGAIENDILTYDDLDDVMDKIGTKSMHWTAQKLTEIQKKFIEYRNDGNINVLGRNNGYNTNNLCTELGEFSGCNVISVSGYAEKVKVGKYVVSDNRYLYKDGSFKTIAEAYSEGILNDDNLDGFIEQFEVTNYIPDSIETAAVNRLNEDGNNYPAAECKKLCAVGDCDLYQAVAGDKNYSVVIGDYTVQSPMRGFHAMIIKNGAAYTLEEACEKNIVNMDDVYAAFKKSYPEATTIQKAKHNYHAFIDYVLNKNSGITKSDIKVKSYNVLKNGTALVYYTLKNGIYEDILETSFIDKYYYVTGRPQDMIFDGTKLYEIKTAYQKGVIGKTELAEIAKQLKDFNESKLTLKAGNSKSSLDLGCAAQSFKGFTSSNAKVAKVISGKLVALKKGTATLTYKPKNGSAYSVKVTVKNSPTLSKTSVSVKKGKTVSVKISGKDSAINNVYKNTKFAKVISKKSAKTIKIRGLKKGKTTLKVTVNGVALKLNVNVK